MQLKPSTSSLSLLLSGSPELHNDVDMKLLFNIWDLNKIPEENALLQVNTNLTIALIFASAGTF